MAYDPSDFLSDDDLQNDPVVSKWRGQAINAIDNGVDAVKVNKMLRQKMEDRGYDVAAIRMPVVGTAEGQKGESTDAAKAVNAVWDKPNKQTKSDYASDVVPQVVKDINSVKNSPEEFGRVEGGADVGKAPMSLLDSAGQAISQGARSGYRGLLDLGGSLESAGLLGVPGMPNEAAGEEAMNQAAAIKKQQDIDAQVEAEKNARTRYNTTAGNAGEVAGGIGAGLLTLGGGTFGTARDVLEDNGTPTQAWAATAGQGALLATQAATAGLGPLAATALTPLEGFIGRKALNEVMPDNMKQDAGNPWMLGAEAIGGGLGGLGVRAAKAAAKAAEFDRLAPPSDLPKSGDYHFDAGASAFKDLSAANEDLDKPVPQYGEKGQMDLNLPQQPEPTAQIGDLFGMKPQDAAKVEAARQAATEPGAAPRSDLAQAGLDLAHETQEPPPPRTVSTSVGDVSVDQGSDVPYLGGSNGQGTVYLDRGFNPIKSIGGQNVDVTPYLAEHEAVEAKLEQQGMSYTDAHEQATQAEHAKLKADGIDPAAYEAAVAPDLVKAGQKQGTAPADLIEKPYDHPHNAKQRQMLAEVEAAKTPEQGQLLPQQEPQQLPLGNMPQGEAQPISPASPEVNAAPDRVGVQQSVPSAVPTAPLAANKVQITQDLNSLRGKNVRLADGQTVIKATVPPEVDFALHNGKLNSGGVFDALLSDRYSHAPQLQALVKHIRDFSDQLGGEGQNVKHEMFDWGNPAHQDYLERHPEAERLKAAAAYDSKTNSIIYFEKPTMSTILHESVHGVTDRAVTAGEQGKLNPAAQAAYNSFNQTFEALRPKLIEKYGDPMGVNEKGLRTATTQNYGLTNLHEYLSEFYSSPAFRDAMKKVSLEDTGIGKTVKAKIQNMYQATVSGIRSILGMPPKAESAFDALFGAHSNFMSKVKPEDLNAKSDFDLFQNKAAEGEQLRRPRGPLEVFGRELFGRGNVPAATDARRFVQGNVNAARAKSTAFKNLGESQRSAVNIDHVNDVLTNTPNAKNAMAAIRQASPRLADALNEMRQRKYDKGLDIRDEVYRNPNATPEEKAIADHIAEHSLEWLPRIYARDKIPNWTANMFKAADKGDKDSLDRINTAKQWLAGKLLPGADKLASMKGEDLADLYRAHMGLDPDAQYRGFSTEAKQTSMRARIASKINDYGNTELFLDHAVRKIAELNPDDVSAITTYFKNTKLGSNVLATRERVPEALRNLWGEVQDPLARMYYGHEEQASQYAQLKAQNDLRDKGLQSNLFATKPTTRNDTQLTGATFGPLQGLYTTKDIARTIQSQRALSSNLSDLTTMAIGDMGGKFILPIGVSQLAKGVGVLARATKVANIIGNWGNFPNNFLGSFLQLASNGNLVNVGSWAKGAKIMAEAIGGSLKRGLSPEAERAYRLNLLEFSQTQELQNNPHSAALSKLMDDMAKSSNPMEVLKSVGKAGKEGWNLLHEVYGAMDLWSKLANFENEYALQKRWNPNMPEPELEAMVAKRINDTNITPSHSPQIVKAAERTGATQYGTYYYQTAKTTATNLYHGSADVLAGIKEGNYEKATHGAARLGGTMLYLTKANAAIGGLVTGAMSLYGLAASKLSPDDPRQKYINKDDFLSSIQPALVTDPNNSKAGEFLYDLSRPNPFGPVQNPLEHLYDAITMMHSDPKGAAEQAQIAINGIKDVTINNPNAMWHQMWKSITGAQPGIASTAPTKYNELNQYLTQKLGMSKESADRVLDLGMIFTPKTIKNVWASQEIPGESPLKPLVAAGVGVQKFDAGEDVQKFLGPALKGSLNTARKPYLDLLKADYDITPESLDNQMQSHMKDLVDPYEKMKAGVEAAKAQGLSEREIGMRLITSGVGNDVAAMLYKDKPIPALMMMGDPVGSLVNEIKAEPDPDKRQQMMDRAKAKVKMFQDLFRKYKDVTMDQLEAE